nr:Retrovirus-related Pol polyprotein from transposon RE1 [Ipomoea batatas]
MGQPGKSNVDSSGVQNKKGRGIDISGRNQKTPPETAARHSGQELEKTPGSVSDNAGQGLVLESDSGNIETTSSANRTAQLGQKLVSGAPSVFLDLGRHAAYGKVTAEMANLSAENGVSPETMNQNKQIEQNNQQAVSGYSANSEKTVSRTLGSDDTFSEKEENEEGGVFGTKLEHNLRERELKERNNLNEEQKESDEGELADKLVPVQDDSLENSQNCNPKSAPICDQNQQTEGDVFSEGGKQNNGQGSEEQPLETESGQNGNYDTEMVNQSEDEEDNRDEDDLESDDMSTEYEDMSEEAVLERIKVSKTGNHTCNKSLSEGGGDGLLAENRFGTQEDIHESAGVENETAVIQNGKTVNSMGDKEINRKKNPTLQADDQCETILMYVSGRGKDEYLTGEVLKPEETDATYRQWKSENHMVMSWLINSMLPGIGENFLLYHTAKEIWDGARDTYSSSENTSELFEIETKLFELKQGDSDVTQYYNTITRFKQGPRSSQGENHEHQTFPFHS